MTHLATVLSPADFQLLSSDIRDVIEEFYNFSAGEVIYFHLMPNFELAMWFFLMKTYSRESDSLLAENIQC